MYIAAKSPSEELNAITSSDNVHPQWSLINFEDMFPHNDHLMDSFSSLQILYTGELQGWNLLR